LDCSNIGEYKWRQGDETSDGNLFCIVGWGDFKFSSILKLHHGVEGWGFEGRVAKRIGNVNLTDLGMVTDTAENNVFQIGWIIENRVANDTKMMGKPHMACHGTSGKATGVGEVG